MPYHHPNPEEKFAATAHLYKKKKEKSCAQKERKIIQKHTHKTAQVSYNILIPRFLPFPSLLRDFINLDEQSTIKDNLSQLEAKYEGFLLINLNSSKIIASIFCEFQDLEYLCNRLLVVIVTSTLTTAII